MTMLDPSSVVGDLSIDGVSMNRAAWMMLDLTPLWTYGKLRVSNRQIATVTGKRPFPPVLDENVVPLPMAIAGDVDNTGASTNGAIYEGLESNINYLLNNVVSIPTNGTGTREGILTMPSGAKRTADVQVTDFDWVNKGPGWILATLELTIPAGRFL